MGSRRYHACHVCLDTKLILTAEGEAVVCEARDHLPMSDAALSLWRSIRRLPVPRKLNGFTVRLARELTLYTSSDPCPAETLCSGIFAGCASPLRIVASHVETLRSVWHLPIGSRRDDPTGYWIITDLEDCKAWLRSATAAPITQLSTIW